jgi:DNA invertase Pin-like site-specific DNA recombinase
MKTYGYVRSSRPPKGVRKRGGDQEDSPLGIESQRREILDAFPDAEIFEDRFKSGRSARRPGLRSMLDRVEAGDLVVVSRLDRLARDSRLAVAIEYELETTREARLVSLRGEGTNRDGSPPDPTSVFLRRVLAAQAELAAAQASAATKSALAVKRGEGFSTNGVAPYGYKVGPDGKIVEDAREQEIIQKIRERTRGRLFEASSADVAEWLTRGGYLNRVGRPWHRSGILRILKTMRTREAVSPAEVTS